MPEPGELRTTLDSGISTTEAPSLAKAAPITVRIKRIGVSARLSALGVDAKGWLEVPPLTKPNLAGWYRLGPTPGEVGPAVIVGHSTVKSGPAVFAKLGDLAAGDTIEVDRATVAVFTVHRVERISKRRFPTAQVYGPTTEAELRVITCGGAFDRATGSYEDNVIVYATLVSTRAI